MVIIKEVRARSRAKERARARSMAKERARAIGGVIKMHGTNRTIKPKPTLPLQNQNCGYVSTFWPDDVVLATRVAVRTENPKM